MTPTHSSTTSRRRFLRQTTGAFAALTAACSSPTEQPAGKRPNILFLLTDDQRWDTIGAMGNPIVKTPNMDRLAKEGVLFRNNFVTTSICAVSRASFFTGLYARCHGIHGFATGLSDEQHAISYPVGLREAGYRTGFIGKFGVGGNDDLPTERYDYFKGFAGQGQYLNEIDGKTVHLTTIMGDQAQEFLGGCSEEQPWNLSISFKAPHVQDGVPPYFINDPAYDHLFDGVELPPFKQMDEKWFNELPEFLRSSESRVRWEQRFRNPEEWEKSVKRYYALIYGVDVQIGRMLETLEQRGMLDNTIVILTGDNGFYLGERGLAGKWYMHEESIRTPLIIRDPRRRETAGTERSEMALNIDISPTILHMAGLAPAPSVNGRDLSPLVAGEKPAWRSEWFYEHLFEHSTIAKSEGVRGERWKYFEFIEKDPPWEALYDLQNDPEENVNLAPLPENLEQLEKMRERRRLWVSNLESWKINQPWQEPA